MTLPLIFSNRPFFWPGVVLLALGLIVLSWNYRRVEPPWLRWLCVLLKALALIAVALCLLEPLWSGRKAKPGANVIAIVADNSQGLQIHDNGETKSRGEILTTLVDAKTSKWLQPHQHNSELRSYHFDSR